MPSPLGLLPTGGLPGGGRFSVPSQPNYRGTPTPYGYASSPNPGSYNPTFGGIPGNVNLPIPFQDISNILPNTGGLNQAASSAVLSELQGTLSPETQALLQDKAAQFGVSSGMPGSGLATNRFLRDLGLTSEQLQGQGVGNLGKLLSTIAGTEVVSPALQAQIASRNAMFNAAPVPGQAQNYAQQLFDKYLQSFRGPGGGTGSMFGPSSGTGGGQQPLGGGLPSGSGEFDSQGNFIGDIPPEWLTSSSAYTTAGPTLDQPPASSNDLLSQPTLSDLIDTGTG